MKVTIDISASELALLNRMGYTQGDYENQTEKQVSDAVHQAIKESETLFNQFGNRYEFIVTCNNDVYYDYEDRLMVHDSEYAVYTNDFETYHLDSEIGYTAIDIEEIAENCKIAAIKTETLKIALENAKEESASFFADYTMPDIIRSLERE